MPSSPITSYSSSINLSRGSSTFSADLKPYQPLESDLNSAFKSIDNILTNQTRAIAHLAAQYRKSKWSIEQMKSSLLILNDSLNKGGKIVVSGMGKSFKIATKTVATLNSLGLHSASLHPSEALHGDLGMIREDHNDSLIIISASGNSPELNLMLNYIPITIPIVLVTCTKISSLASNKRISSVLYAELPSHLNEKSIYGLSAPTISTTLCLTLLDAVSISLSELNIKDINARKSIFGSRHPGGAIGINYQNSIAKKEDDKMMGTLTIENNDLCNELIIKKEEYKAEEQEEEDEAGLDLNSILLLQKIKSSLYIELTDLPTDELELLRYITMYDYLLLSNSNGLFDIIDSNIVRALYRDFRDKMETNDVTDLIWRIRESSISSLSF